MITSIKTVSSAEAAIILWRKLGPLRVWPDFLADCIRYRQDINGHTLLPCARKANGRANSPMYAADDMLRFIREVKACTHDAGPSEITFTTLALDDALPWRMNTFDRAGRPVRRKCSIYGGASYGASACKPIISTRRGGSFAPYMH